MNNSKGQIRKLRDNAELAWASYGYFHFINKKFQDKDEYGDRKGDSIMKTDILDITYKDYETIDSTFFNTQKLKGDFAPNQAKRFFEKYELLIHQPNTDSGFSATLFQNKTTKEFILAFRGTEFGKLNDILTDYYIGTNTNDTQKIIEQYFEMLIFYEEKVLPILKQNNIAKIIVTGHSLGGFLAQLFSVSYPQIINEVYTYNAPGVINDKFTNTFYYISMGIQFLGVYKVARYVMNVKVLFSNISLFFGTYPPLKAQDIFRHKIDKDVFVGVIQVKSNHKQSIKFDENTQRIQDIQPNIYLDTRVPYFLKYNDNKLATNSNQPIIIDENLGQYAKEFYEIISTESYEGKYLYYRYIFGSTMKIDKFEYIMLDYNLEIPFKNMLDILYYLQKIENKAYPANTLNSNKIFHIISIGRSKRKDFIGYLGYNTFGQKIEIYVDTMVGNSLIDYVKSLIDTHSIIYLTSSLYFYSYLLALDSNLALLDDESNKAIQSLNNIGKSITSILYYTDSYNKKRDEAIMLANDNDTFELDEPQHYVYAIIDKTLFEATLKIKQDKVSINENIISGTIEGILYLQDNNIFLKLLSRNTIKQANKNTNLAILLAIHEHLFLITVSKENNKQVILLEHKESIVRLLNYKTPRTQIFCYNLEHIDDMVITGYANEALKYYPKLKEAK